MVDPPGPRGSTELVSLEPLSHSAVLPTACRPARPPRTFRADPDLVARLADCQDEPTRRVLTNELAAINMPVADSVVSRYRSRGIATEDLQQVAYLALTKAARRFDPSAGHDFLSFCVPTIRGEVRRYFRDKGWMVRPPRGIQELQQRLTLARATSRPVSGGRRHPTSWPSTSARTPSTSVRPWTARAASRPTSLDRPVGNDEQGASLGDLLGDEDDVQSAAEARVALAPVVRRLSRRDRHILELRFFEGLTQREIADDIGVTQMQVSRLLTRIFRDIREDLGSIEDPGTGD